MKIKQLVVNHFKKLFSAEANGAPEFLTRTSDFLSLTLTLAQELELPFTNSDIQLALKNMHPFKAPGPDGFNAFSFQRYWHIVERDVCIVVLQALRGSPIPRGLNDNFTLIPKVPHPERVS